MGARSRCYMTKRTRENREHPVTRRCHFASTAVHGGPSEGDPPPDSGTDLGQPAAVSDRLPPRVVLWFVVGSVLWYICWWWLGLWHFLP